LSTKCFLFDCHAAHVHLYMTVIIKFVQWPLMSSETTQHQRSLHSEQSFSFMECQPLKSSVMGVHAVLPRLPTACLSAIRMWKFAIAFTYLY